MLYLKRIWGLKNTLIKPCIEFDVTRISICYILIWATKFNVNKIFPFLISHFMEKKLQIQISSFRIERSWENSTNHFLFEHLFYNQQRFYNFMTFQVSHVPRFLIHHLKYFGLKHSFGIKSKLVSFVICCCDCTQNLIHQFHDI